MPSFCGAGLGSRAGCPRGQRSAPAGRVMGEHFRFVPGHLAEEGASDKGAHLISGNRGTSARFIDQRFNKGVNLRSPASLESV